MLAPLLDLPGVRAAADEARAAVDEVHRHRANRRGWPATAAEASMRAARASAVLDGGDGRLTDGTVSDPVLAGAVRVADAYGTLLATWQRAPLQALARLHVLAAADLTSDDGALGRPRESVVVSARLRQLAVLVTGSAPGAGGSSRSGGSATGSAAGLAGVAGLGSAHGSAAGSAGSAAVPGVVLAAVVHGEVLALAPFGTADGVVARAASRLTAMATGLDAKGLAVPEVGHLRGGGAQYRTLAAAFATGSPDGVRDWLLHCCQAWLTGAREATAIADAAA